MTHFEKFLCSYILLVYFGNCVTSDDQESMTDTVLGVHDQKISPAPQIS